jgi:CubicO group peptidase (beta-lactamase class C family)
MKNTVSIWIVAVTIGLLFVIACSTSILFKENVTNPYPWPVSAPEDQGLNPDVLQGALEIIENMDYVSSLLIVRNGYLVVEWYHHHTANTMNPVYSATKSVTSALLGIALEKGYIDSVDQKLEDYFQDELQSSTDPRKHDITIQHLLTMQAGFGEILTMPVYKKNWNNLLKIIIESPLQYDPGEDFCYSSHSAHLLSGIITRATGMSTLAFAQKHLFRPLGIQRVKWLTDGNGIHYGGSCLYLSPRDMARFGYLYLKNGLIDDKQILPSEWIETSVRNYRDFTEPWQEMEDVGYGYLWWTGRFGRYPVYFASGYGGQFILHVPDLDMVIVTTANADTETEWHQMVSLLSVVSNHILPAVVMQ